MWNWKGGGGREEDRGILSLSSFFSKSPPQAKVNLSNSKQLTTYTMNTG